MNNSFTVTAVPPRCRGSKGEATKALKSGERIRKEHLIEYVTMGHMATAISAAGFGTLGIFAKFAYADGGNTVTVLAIRFLVAAVLFWLWLWLKGIDPRVSRRELIFLLGLGGIGYGSFSAVYRKAFRPAAFGVSCDPRDYLVVAERHYHRKRAPGEQPGIHGCKHNRLLAASDQDLNRVRKGSSIMLRLTSRVYMLPGAVNLGIFLHPDSQRCLVVDTGLDKSSGARLHAAVKVQAWTVAGILNTHAHADHFGGNQILVQRTGARVFASEIEADILRHPWWEPTYLNSGASPPEMLRNKFLMAPPSPVDVFLKPGEQAAVELARCQVEVWDLAGHSHGMLGYSADGVLFCGDAFLDQAILEKHGIPFLVDVQRSLNTIERLENLNPQEVMFIVPGHGKVCRVPDELSPHLRAYRDRIEKICDLMLRCLQVPRENEEILRSMLEEFNVSPRDLGSYCLYRTTIAAYLGYLLDLRLVEVSVQGGSLVWCRC